MTQIRRLGFLFFPLIHNTKKIKETYSSDIQHIPAWQGLATTVYNANIGIEIPAKLAKCLVSLLFSQDPDFFVSFFVVVSLTKYLSQETAVCLSA